MKEKNLRKLHREASIILALLMVLQAVTGLVFTLNQVAKIPGVSAQMHEGDTEGERTYAEDHQDGGDGHGHGRGIMTILASIHYRGGTIGVIYRLVTGLGILWMAGTGSLIYFRLKARQK